MRNYKDISEKTRQKMRESALKRDNSKRIASLPRGKKHHAWTNEPSILTLHKRIHRAFGKAKNFKCSRCENQARDWALIEEKYTDNIKDYQTLCRSCHIKLDRNWIKKS